MSDGEAIILLLILLVLKYLFLDFILGICMYAFILIEDSPRRLRLIRKFLWWTIFVGIYRVDTFFTLVWYSWLLLLLVRLLDYAMPGIIPR